MRDGHNGIAAAQAAAEEKPEVAIRVPPAAGAATQARPKAGTFVEDVCARNLFSEAVDFLAVFPDCSGGAQARDVKLLSYTADMLCCRAIQSEQLVGYLLAAVGALEYGVDFPDRRFFPVLNAVCILKYRSITKGYFSLNLKF